MFLKFLTQVISEPFEVSESFQQLCTWLYLGCPKLSTKKITKACEIRRKLIFSPTLPISWSSVQTVLGTPGM